MHEWCLHWPVCMHKADNGCVVHWYKLHIVWLFRHWNMTVVNLDLSFVYTYKNPNNKQVIHFIPEIIHIDNNIYFLANINLWYKFEYKYKCWQQPVSMRKYITCTECSLVLIVFTDTNACGHMFGVFSQRSQPNT